jgi:hypothetical protein
LNPFSVKSDRLLGLAARDRRVLALLEWGYLRFLRARPTLQRLANRIESRRRVI